jgi:hypothetical protein
MQSFDDDRESMRPGSDPIESLLRHDASEHAAAYIDDAGFTAKVMAALPPEIAPVPAWRKPAVALMWGVACVGAALALPQVAIDVGREAFSLLAAQRVSLPHVGMALALLGVGTFSAAAYALRQD